MNLQEKSKLKRKKKLDVTSLSESLNQDEFENDLEKKTKRLLQNSEKKESQEINGEKNI